MGYPINMDYNGNNGILMESYQDIISTSNIYYSLSSNISYSDSIIDDIIFEGD